MSPTDKTEALEQWYRFNKGYLNERVRIVEDAAAGVHCKAMQPIDAGSTIAITPHWLTLSYLNALVDDAYPVFRQQRHRFRVEVMGFFYLVIQYVNRHKSFWKPYLDSLPQPDGELAHPMFTDELDDVAWLDGTDAWYTVCARKEKYEECYHDGIGVLKEAGLDVEPYTW